MTTSTTPIPGSKNLILVRRKPAALTAADVSRERSLWGPHPDPAIRPIEGALYAGGFDFLMELYAGAFGRYPARKLQKALPPGGVSSTIPPSDWGALAESFAAPGHPLEIRDGWARLIDRLASRIFPQKTKDDLANGVAIRAHWLGKVRTRSEELGAEPPPTSWHEATGRMSAFEREAMEWTKTRALEGCKSLDENARRGLMSALVTSRQAGEGAQALSRRCLDGFGDLNRDWRRLALTETSAAVFNGTLASVPPDEEWEAEWITAARSCPWCLQWKGQRFKIVRPDDPKRNGQTDMWAGKTNIGRSGSPTTKQGLHRSTGQIYWPCQPCHPNCSCGLTMRRVGR